MQLRSGSNLTALGSIYAEKLLAPHQNAPPANAPPHPKATPSQPLTLRAILVKDLTHPVEQRVHHEAAVQLLHAQLPGICQRVFLLGLCSAPPPPLGISAGCFLAAVCILRATWWMHKYGKGMNAMKHVVQRHASC